MRCVQWCLRPAERKSTERGRCRGGRALRFPDSPLSFPCAGRKPTRPRPPRAGRRRSAAPARGPPGSEPLGSGGPRAPASCSPGRAREYPAGSAVLSRLRSVTYTFLFYLNDGRCSHFEERGKNCWFCCCGEGGGCLSTPFLKRNDLLLFSRRLFPLAFVLGDKGGNKSIF